jgi:hypothetical protein
MNMKCERCFVPGNVSKMSIFNTQMICPECQKKEEAHPEYNTAKEAELNAVQNGDYNFPGIGLPSDL